MLYPSKLKRPGVVRFRKSLIGVSIVSLLIGSLFCEVVMSSSKALCVKNQWYPICDCWCGERIHNLMYQLNKGHSIRGRKNRKKGEKPFVFALSTRDDLLPLCRCEWHCGEHVLNHGASYVPAHQQRGKPRTAATKRKIRDANLIRVDTPERYANVGKALRGTTWSAETKLRVKKEREAKEAQGWVKKPHPPATLKTRINMKVAALERLIKEMEEFGNTLTWAGHEETRFIRFLQRFSPYTIADSFQVGKKGGKKNCRFAVLDGYIKELNLAIEFDEEYHDTDKQKKLDVDRQEMVRMHLPDIVFWRVPQAHWDLDHAQVLYDFNFILEYVASMRSGDSPLVKELRNGPECALFG